MKHIAQEITVLRHLLSLCEDGAAGYRRASELVEDPVVHRFLARRAAEREEVVSVFTNKLVELGHKPVHDGSVAGALHRRWLGAVSLVTGHDPGAVLHACERGEQETLAEFARALGDGLPLDVHVFVQAQLARILNATAALHREEDAVARA